MLKIRSQEERHMDLLKAGKQAKNKLEELVPEISLKEKGNIFISFYGLCDLIFYNSV